MNMKEKFPIAALALLMVCGGAGCTKRIYVPVESERIVYDTVQNVHESSDSVVVRDSIITAVRQDTVRIEVWRWRERHRILHDTIVNTRRDTVRESRIVEPIATADKRQSLSRVSLLTFIGSCLFIMAAILIMLHIVKYLMNKSNF